MVDLTDDFVKASRHVWSERDLYEALGSLASEVPGMRVLWDDGVPENWALLLGQEEELGVVCTVAKIAILMPACPQVIEARLHKGGVKVLWATGWDTYDYLLNAEVVQEAFPNWKWADPDVGRSDPHGLSIHDIWYLSVA